VIRQPQAPSDFGPNQPMKLTGPALWLFETQSRCSRPGNLSLALGPNRENHAMKREQEGAGGGSRWEGAGVRREQGREQGGSRGGSRCQE